MGFTINEKVKTVLTYQDIALIAAMYGSWKEAVKDGKDEKILTHAGNLVNRLGGEMSAYPLNDFTKDPDGSQRVDDNGIRLMREMLDVLDDKIHGPGYKIEDLRWMNELIEEVNAYIGHE